MFIWSILGSERGWSGMSGRECNSFFMKKERAGACPELFIAIILLSSPLLRLFEK